MAKSSHLPGQHAELAAPFTCQLCHSLTCQSLQRGRQLGNHLWHLEGLHGAHLPGMVKQQVLPGWPTLGCLLLMLILQSCQCILVRLHPVVKYVCT